ncbi:hypothetical protein [Ktedonobacter racemifer]|uniref:Uncharacterized protein n=1 Tax=Ktedonobacter racemifer DSM 44963 TaxID=485913 RepID=D6TUQ4_KTERA|nr:hypothetical protein [Ktedonobacter racemifer]EFH85230.1 hypothetical protein Krac_6409 [Ktedonobacter racemifer DSM 44963]
MLVTATETGIIPVSVAVTRAFSDRSSRDQIRLLYLIGRAIQGDMHAQGKYISERAYPSFITYTRGENHYQSHHALSPPHPTVAEKKPAPPEPDDLEIVGLDLTNLDNEFADDVQYGLTPDELAYNEPIAAPPCTFQSKFHGLRDWFAQRRLRDLKTMLFLYEASRVDASREYTLTEIASGLQMSANSMRTPALDGDLIA